MTSSDRDDIDFDEDDAEAQARDRMPASSEPAILGFRRELWTPETDVRAAAALEAAHALASRVRRRDAQVRRLFVDRQVPGQPENPLEGRGTASSTPLAYLLRGGRGGRVRLTLYLSLLWVAANPPHDVTYPARAWATLLGLTDPEGNGSRRINDAIAWLVEHHFIETIPRPGHPTTLTLLDESGTGLPYQVPGAAMNQLRTSPESDWSRHRYFKLPYTFWTCGWVTVLSGPAIAMLLVLLMETSGHDSAAEIWFSPATAERRFSLSEDTRASGLRELAQHRLITTHRRPISSNALEFRRLRNTYTLHLDRLNSPPQVAVGRATRRAVAARRGGR
jgi:hypothetical protein